MKAFFYSIVCVLLFPQLCFAVYVDHSAPGPIHNGSSWATAYKTITEAVNSISIGGEIWIKHGVYKERLTLNSHIKLYGGFAGCETNINQRVPQAFPTIIDGENLGRVIDLVTNKFCTIDGLIIRNGRAASGGGIQGVAGCKLFINNCRIEFCEATQLAGGVYYGKYCEGTMTNTVLADNKAPIGGGTVIEYHSYPTLSNILFLRNHATVSGGAVYCPFHSGGVMNYCTFVYNQADVNGGAVWVHHGGPVEVNNSIIAFNSAPVGGGIHGGGSVCHMSYSHTNLYQNDGGNIGGVILPPSTWPGNFSADPMFLMPDREEFCLHISSTSTNQGAYPYSSIYALNNIGSAKLLPDGTSIQLTGKLITASNNNIIGLQEPSEKISIVADNISLPELTTVKSITGELTTLSCGTRTLNTSSFQTANVCTTNIKPIAAGVSLLNKHLYGMRVKTWGRVQSITSDGFVLEYGGHQINIIYDGSVALSSFVTAEGSLLSAGVFKASFVSLVVE